MNSAALSYAKQSHGTSSKGGNATNNAVSAGGTGQRSNHARGVSNHWNKVDRVSTLDVSQKESSSRREDQKYGISLTKIMRDDESRSSDDIELIQHQVGPATPKLPTHPTPARSSPTQNQTQGQVSPSTPALPSQAKPRRSSSRLSSARYQAAPASPTMRSPSHHNQAQQPGGTDKPVPHTGLAMGTYTTVESNHTPRSRNLTRTSDERLVGGERSLHRTNIWQDRTVEVTIASATIVKSTET